MSEKHVVINFYYDSKHEEEATSVISNMIVEAEDMVEEFFQDKGLELVRYKGEEDNSYHIQLVEEEDE